MKEHNQYLIKVISGMQDKEKQYKSKIKKYQERVQSLEKDKKIQ